MYVIFNGYGDEIARSEDMPDLAFDLSGLDELDKPRGERDPWPTISAVDPYGNAVSVTTNRDGEGLFERLPDGGGYQQLAGTLQYHMPRSESSAQYALRRRYLDMFVRDESMVEAMRQADADAEMERRTEELWPL